MFVDSAFMQLKSWLVPVRLEKLAQSRLQAAAHLSICVYATTMAKAELQSHCVSAVRHGAARACAATRVNFEL